MKSADKIIKFLKLEKHPEGGYFRETYRSAGDIEAEALPERYERDHAYSTAIYFLLKRGEFSAFHEIVQDEVWHHYAGAAVHVHIIDHNGKYRIMKTGMDLEKGETPQGVVYGGEVFGATVANDPDHDFALVGCTVAPGFDFRDFRLIAREELMDRFPEHAEIIGRLTRS